MAGDIEVDGFEAGVALVPAMPGEGGITAGKCSDEAQVWILRWLAAGYTAGEIRMMLSDNFDIEVGDTAIVHYRKRYRAEIAALKAQAGALLLPHLRGWAPEERLKELWDIVEYVNKLPKKERSAAILKAKIDAIRAIGDLRIHCGLDGAGGGTVSQHLHLPGVKSLEDIMAVIRQGKGSGGQDGG